MFHISKGRLSIYIITFDCLLPCFRGIFRQCLNTSDKESLLPLNVKVPLTIKLFSFLSTIQQMVILPGSYIVLRVASLWRITPTMIVCPGMHRIQTRVWFRSTLEVGRNFRNYIANQDVNKTIQNKFGKYCLTELFGLYLSTHQYVPSNLRVFLSS